MSTRRRAEKLVEHWNKAWPGIQVKITAPSADFPRMSEETAGADLIERICVFMKDELALARAERKEEIERLKARVVELTRSQSETTRTPWVIC